MPWECGECGSQEGKKDGEIMIDALCHHCGKPLCKKHRISIEDDAFSNTSTLSRQAFHCADCKKAYHPRAMTF